MSDQVGRQLEHVNPGVRWYTYLNNGKYVQLTIKEQNDIEGAISKGAVLMMFVWEDYHCDDPSEKFTEYEIELEDLSEVFQVNTKTNTRRRLYRIAVQ